MSFEIQQIKLFNLLSFNKGLYFKKKKCFLRTSINRKSIILLLFTYVKIKSHLQIPLVEAKRCLEDITHYSKQSSIV